MTAPDRLLATLAAALAGGRAATLLARLGTPGRTEAIALAGRLSAAPRAGRLRALAAAIAPDGRELRARADAAAAQERAPVGRLLAALPAGAGLAAPAAPLVRLCRERISI